MVIKINRPGVVDFSCLITLLWYCVAEAGLAVCLPTLQAEFPPNDRTETSTNLAWVY